MQLIRSNRLEGVWETWLSSLHRLIWDESTNVSRQNADWLIGFLTNINYSSESLLLWWKDQEQDWLRFYATFASSDAVCPHRWRLAPADKKTQNLIIGICGSLYYFASTFPCTHKVVRCGLRIKTKTKMQSSESSRLFTEDGVWFNTHLKQKTKYNPCLSVSRLYSVEGS